MIRRALNIGKIRIVLWIVSVILLGISFCLETISLNPKHDVSVLNLQTRIENISNKAVAIKSKWLLKETSGSIDLISKSTLEKFRQTQTSFYLLENDSIINWWGDDFSENITSLLTDRSRIVTKFCDQQIVVRRLHHFNRTAALVIVLKDENGVANRALFEDDNVKFANSSQTYLLKNKNWHTVDLKDTSFLVMSTIQATPPLIAYILGWLGIAMVLVLTTLWFKRKATTHNAIRINVLALLTYCTLRVLLLMAPFGVCNCIYLDNFHVDLYSQFMFSPYSLLVNVIFILLQSYIYFTTLSKIRQEYTRLNRFKQLAFYYASILYRATMLVYIHWAIVENIYNPLIDTDIFNILSMNSSGIVFYITCGIYFLARMLQNDILNGKTYKGLFIQDIIWSLPVLLLLLFLVRDQLHGTWYIAVIYSIGFRLIGLLHERVRPFTNYCLAVGLTALYIACLVGLETTAARKEMSARYQEEILSSSRTEKAKTDTRYPGYSYLFINEFTFDMGSNNSQVELQEVMPFINSDTTIYYEQYKYKIMPLEGTSLIISSKYLSALDLFSLFCYVYVLIFFIGIVVSWAMYIRIEHNGERKVGLIVKIQGMVVGIVFAIVATASLVSIDYTITSTNASNRKIINNLLQTVQNSITNYEVSNTNPIEWLQNWYSISGRGLTQNMAVYGTNGRIIIGHPNSFHAYLLESEAIMAIDKNKNAYFGKSEVKNGSNFYTLFFPVHHHEVLFGFVGISVLDPRNQPNTIPITEELLNLFIIVLFVVVWLSLLLNNIVIRPLMIVQDALATVSLMRKVPLRKNNAYNYEVNSIIKLYNDMIDTIKRNNIELARIERQSAWQDMARQIAHDIKNPLTPIMLKIQILQRKMDLNSPDIQESTRETMEMILTQMNRINEVVEQFREFAQAGRFNTVVVDLSEIVLNEVAVYDKFDNINVTFDNVVGRKVFVYGNKNQLGRVVGNLCKNAVEALSGIEDGGVRLSLKQTEDNAIIEVADNGPGISDEVAKRLFDPSFTTKTRGSGLGLPICKRIIEEYNGEIKYQNNPNGGVTFVIIFPLA